MVTLLPASAEALLTIYKEIGIEEEKEITSTILALLWRMRKRNYTEKRWRVIFWPGKFTVR